MLLSSILLKLQCVISTGLILTISLHEHPKYKIKERIQSFLFDFGQITFKSLLDIHLLKLFYVLMTKNKKKRKKDLFLLIRLLRNLSSVDFSLFPFSFIFLYFSLVSTFQITHGLFRNKCKK
jgi:hypothetical protein